MELPKNFDFFAEYNGLDIGEIEDVEELTGIPMVSAAKPGFNPPMKMIRAVLFMIMRRTDDTVTFEELRSIKLTELSAEAEETELDPTSDES